MKCGKSKNEIKEAKAAGCMIHEGDNDYITADQGSITYPLNGNSYTNFEKCIWQIRPKTANKFLKVSIQLQSDSRSMQLIGFAKYLTPKISIPLVRLFRCSENSII